MSSGKKTKGKWGWCLSDASRTYHRLPGGNFLCEECSARYQEYGWLDASLAWTTDFFDKHPQMKAVTNPDGTVLAQNIEGPRRPRLRPLRKELIRKKRR